SVYGTSIGSRIRGGKGRIPKSLMAKLGSLFSLRTMTASSCLRSGSVPRENRWLSSSSSNPLKLSQEAVWGGAGRESLGSKWGVNSRNACVRKESAAYLPTPEGAQL